MCAITEHLYSCCNSYQIAKESCPEAGNCIWLHNAGTIRHDQCDGCRLMAGFWADIPQPAFSDLPSAGGLTPKADAATGLESFAFDSLAPLAPPPPAAEHDAIIYQHNDSWLQRSHQQGLEGRNVDLHQWTEGANQAESLQGNDSVQASTVQQSATDDSTNMRIASLSVAQGHNTQAPPSPSESVRHLRVTTPRMGAYAVDMSRERKAWPHSREVAGHYLRPQPKPTRKAS